MSVAGCSPCSTSGHPLYAEVATEVIDTDELAPAEVAQRIASGLGAHNG